MTEERYVPTWGTKCGEYPWWERRGGPATRPEGARRHRSCPRPCRGPGGTGRADPGTGGDPRAGPAGAAATRRVRRSAESGHRRARQMSRRAARLTFFTLFSRSMAGLARSGSPRPGSARALRSAQTSAALRQWLQPNKGRAAANPRRSPPARQPIPAGGPRPAPPGPARPESAPAGRGSQPGRSWCGVSPAGTDVCKCGASRA